MTSRRTFDDGQRAIGLIEIDCYLQCFVILLVHQQIRHFLFPVRDDVGLSRKRDSAGTYMSSTSSTLSRLAIRSSSVESWNE